MAFFFQNPNMPEQEPMSIPVPFIQQPIGAGDVIANLARLAGIQPSQDCGCKQRQEALNQRFNFSPW